MDITENFLLWADSWAIDIRFAPKRAAASVSTSQMNSAISEAAKGNKAEIVIETKVEGDATKVSLEVTKAYVGQMVSQTEAALTVKTDIADVKLPASSLEDLSRRSGGTITISTEIAEDAVRRRNKEAHSNASAKESEVPPGASRPPHR